MNEVDAVALKPCPFCGGNAATIFRSHRIPFVECTPCGIERSGNTESEAIAAWNTRDQRALDELQAEIDRLTKDRDEAAAAERAKVVAWLRGGAGTDTTQLPRSTRALFLRGLHGYADAIEQGAHHDPE